MPPIVRPLKYTTPKRRQTAYFLKLHLDQGDIDRATYRERIAQLNRSELKFREKKQKKEHQRDAQQQLRNLADLFTTRARHTIDMVELRRHHVQDNQVLDFLSRLEGNWNIKIGNKYYALSDKTRLRLRQLFENQVINQADLVKSDQDFIATINTYDAIEVIPFELTHRRERPNGAFFKYNNLTKFDLSRYGIYKDNNPAHYSDNCLITALRSANVPEADIEKVKFQVKNRQVPMCKFKDVAEIIKRKIEMKRLEQDCKNKIVYGKEFDGDAIVIGLVDDHYFFIEKTNITSFCLKHYDEVKDIEDCNIIIGKRKNKYWERDAKRCVDSFDVVKCLLDNKDSLLRKISFDDEFIASTQFYDSIPDEIKYLEYDVEKSTRPVEIKKRKDKKLKNVFFDFETNPNDVHSAYLCRTYDGEVHREFIGDNCALKMLFSLEQDTRLIAHNATYDFRFIIQHMINIHEISRGNRMISASGNFNNHYIEVKDSYHLISMKLAKFPDIFKIGVAEKEIMPYSMYTQENIEKRFVEIDYALDYVPAKQHSQFLANIDRWGCRKQNTYDIIKYSSEYCKIDCEILCKGYSIYREWILTAFNLDIDTILTAASLAHQYFVNEGCYEGVFELGGIPQMFIQQCVVGGRVMCSDNEKKRVNEVLNDFDAVSLYPSAMSRMEGFLVGVPKVIQNKSWDWVQNQNGYFVEIMIKSVGTKLSFPLMSFKNESGIRIFTNDMVGKTMLCDKTTLEDLITFQQIEFDVVRGYYFDEGHNTKIKEVINYVFSKRVEEKKNKNPIQEVYKLIMNSGYGKSIMKPVETETHFFDSIERFQTYLSRNYNWIESWVHFGSKTKVNTCKIISDHFNICQVGVSILSQSKRIMNEVMCLAESENIEIFYQDTDSLHLRDADIDRLGEAFKNKYSRELIGSGMGQFHSDFSLDGCKNIVAVRSIFLGKKSYIDELRGELPDGTFKTGYHVRMKGIPNACITYLIEQGEFENEFELYEALYDGEEVEFDLTNQDTRGTYWKFENDYTIRTIHSGEKGFSRSVKF